MDTLIAFGDGIKSVEETEDSYKFGAFLVVFNSPDISSYRDSFTKSTDFGFEDGETRPILYNHGLDGTFGKTSIGKARLFIKDDGVWMEGEVKKRRDYLEKHVERVGEGLKATVRHRGIDAPMFGTSSGATAHSVIREAKGQGHEILQWHIGEASITPTPAEPQTACMSLKSLQEMEMADGVEVEFEFKYSPRQPRDDLGRWSDGSGGISVGHALHVARSEGIDEKHHAGIRDGILSGQFDTREKVLAHIDAIHAGTDASSNSGIRHGEKFSVSDARYAKGKKVVRIEKEGMFKGTGERLAESLGGIHTGRDRGYQLSPNRAEAWKQLHAAGWDAGTLIYKAQKPKFFHDTLAPNGVSLKEALTYVTGAKKSLDFDFEEWENDLELTTSRMNTSSDLLDVIGAEIKFDKNEARDDDGQWTGGGGGDGQSRHSNRAKVEAFLKQHGIHAGSAAHDTVHEAIQKGHIKNAAELRATVEHSEKHGHDLGHLHTAINLHGSGDGAFRSQHHPDSGKGKGEMPNHDLRAHEIYAPRRRATDRMPGASRGLRDGLPRPQKMSVERAQKELNAAQRATKEHEAKGHDGTPESYIEHLTKKIDLINAETQAHVNLQDAKTKRSEDAEDSGGATAKLGGKETSKILAEHGHGANSVIASVVKEAVKQGHIASAATLRTILKETNKGSSAGTIGHLHSMINKHADGPNANGKFRSSFSLEHKSWDAEFDAPEEEVASGATDGDEVKSLDADLWTAQLKNEMLGFDLSLLGLSAQPHTA